MVDTSCCSKVAPASSATEGKVVTVVVAEIWGPPELLIPRRRPIPSSDILPAKLAPSSLSRERR